MFESCVVKPRLVTVACVALEDVHWPQVEVLCDVEDESIYKTVFGTDPL